MVRLHTQGREPRGIKQRHHWTTAIARQIFVEVRPFAHRVATNMVVPIRALRSDPLVALPSLLAPASARRHIPRQRFFLLQSFSQDPLRVAERNLRYRQWLRL